MAEQPTISTHVLDAATGLPAPGIVVTLIHLPDDPDALDEPTGGTTDDDGRIRSLTKGPLKTGSYLIVFRVAGPFFREVSIEFVVDDVTRSYHVPLLLAPYSLTSYRGS
jgi:5-hydroxyisourate hydrolase